MLEWIQVSLKYRRKGLGAFLVRELLWRMKGKTDFVTVSGKVDDPNRPEQLYRSCGFTGNDIWYISRK
jgi:GNAT superfamily N-acetyltransferase